MVPTTIALIFVELVGAGTGPLYENLPPASASFVMGDAERTEMDGIKCGTEKEKHKYGRKHSRR